VALIRLLKLEQRLHRALGQKRLDDRDAAQRQHEQPVAMRPDYRRQNEEYGQPAAVTERRSKKRM
jgi:ATP phosphoribosyltransferase regulatory subunit HisZ